ncbi:MAG: DUF427 domain-containing protein [Actinomycetota bacterium]
MADILKRLKRSNASGERRAFAGEIVVASATETQVVEGNDYFAPEDVNWEYLEPSTKTTVCPWKGTATYYDVVTEGERLPAAAFVYEDPFEAARKIKGHVSFWRGVKVRRE